MGYEINIADCSLVKTEPFDINPEDDNVDDGWYFKGDDLCYIENYFNASSEVIDDLELFRDNGVRGSFIIYGEQGEWMKYVLDDNCVRDYQPTLLWGDDVEAASSGDEIQAALIIGIEDIKGCLIDDIANPVAMEKVASLMDNKEWVQNIINIMQKRLSLLDWNEVLAEAISDNL